MILVVAKRNLGKARALLSSLGEACFQMGEVVGSRGAARGVCVKRLGILLSGRGSNFEAIAENIERGRLNAEIAAVISNRPEARGIEIARERGLPAVVLPSKGVPREEYDRRVVAELRESWRGTGLPGWIHAAAERRSFAGHSRCAC